MFTEIPPEEFNFPQPQPGAESNESPTGYKPTFDKPKECIQLLSVIIRSRLDYNYSVRFFTITVNFSLWLYHRNCC